LWLRQGYYFLDVVHLTTVLRVAPDHLAVTQLYIAVKAAALGITAADAAVN